MSNPARPNLPLIVVAGPTATGKTAVAAEIAKRIDGEIVSADSMQVYRHLSIGTAKPTPDELQGVPCHLIDFVEPDQQYNAAQFVTDAERILTDIAARGKRAIICGGTGMYIRSLILGIFDEPSRDEATRAKLNSRAEVEGLAALYEELQRVDPGATHIMPNDRTRIIRALEVFETTGKPLSSFHRQQDSAPRHDASVWVLHMERDKLYARINARVDEMARRGLLEEIEAYMKAGWSEQNPAVRALGYSDLIRHLRGEIGLDQALEEMKKRTRNYAKRQLTWFRSVKGATWIEVDTRAAGDVGMEIVQAL